MINEQKRQRIQEYINQLHDNTTMLELTGTYKPHVKPEDIEEYKKLNWLSNNISITTLPDEIEENIVKNYFHYSDIYYLSSVCKKWREINNYITELKLFLKHSFDLILDYPLRIPYQNEIERLELFDGPRNSCWRGEDLRRYYRYSHGKIQYEETRQECLQHQRYGQRRFNENHLNAMCQKNNKIMLQFTYFPAGGTFSGLCIDNLKDMKKLIKKLKKRYLLDKKNKGFRIKLHNRLNYTTGAITLLIWR